MWSFSSSVLALSPSGYWKLDDASSPFVDSSSNAKNATVSGSGIIYQVTGLVPLATDTAAQFGSNSYASCTPASWTANNSANGATVNALALAIWFSTSNLPAVGSYEVLAQYAGFAVCLDSNGHLGFKGFFGPYNGGPGALNGGYFLPAFHAVGDGVNYADGQKHEIIANFRVSTSYFYLNTGMTVLGQAQWSIDGQALNAYTNVFSSTYLSNNNYGNQTYQPQATSYLGMGNFNSGMQYAFSGVLDDVAFFSSVNLSQSQVNTLVAPAYLQSNVGEVLAEPLTETVFWTLFPEQPFSAPEQSYHIEALPFAPLIELQRPDMEKLYAQLACPPQPPAQVIYMNGSAPSTSSPTSTTGHPNVMPGYFYRCPVGTTILKGQALPKYDNLFTRPYSAILYPVGDTYYGYMLVKVLNPVSSPLPSDMTELLSSVANSEVQRLFNTFFAF